MNTAITAPTSPWHTREAARTLARLTPRLSAHFARQNALPDWPEFQHRLHQHFPHLFDLLLAIYGQQYDFFYHLEELLLITADAYLARPADLKALDRQRETDPNWFHTQTMLGGVCYVDRFAGDLPTLHTKLPYFKDLGLTYLHLMPLFKAPQPENDGGYAISDYRTVDPALGTIDDLKALAADLRANGISLVLDFVFNHTSHEHPWAMQAIAGDPDYRDFYFFFPTRDMPNAYERHLREIFPDEHPGAFIWREDVQHWVWATFHSYQWDLNYANPAVFRAMAGEMFYLLNLGIEGLRLDAVAFIWKKLGTPCENLPEAHLLIQAFNTLTRLIAPGVLLKSEAIVHPDDVIKYISPAECQISYNPLLMALLWDSLATRKTDLLRLSMGQRFHLPDGTAWVNYLRSHDDIGWTFSDEDAAQLAITGYDHRQFLTSFYTGRFPGSFARGLTFQENPRTGDARISGTAASLAGLEKALHEETDREVELALKRLQLLHSVILSIGGIPLIYLGDELAQLNDYTYRDHPGHAHDSRWVHRPAFDWAAADQRHDPTTRPGQLYNALRHLITCRQTTPAFAGNDLDVLDLTNPHLFAYVRTSPPGHPVASRVLVVANFSEQSQSVPRNLLHLYGLGYAFRDLITDSHIALDHDLQLTPYQALWLVPD